MTLRLGFNHVPSKAPFWTVTVSMKQNLALVGARLSLVPGQRQPDTGSTAPSLLTCASFLQPKLLEDLSKLLMFPKVWQLDVHTSTEPRSQVGWAGQDVAQMRIPHELMVFGLEEIFYL